MSETKYDRIPTKDPNEIDAITSTKVMGADPNLMELNREEDLLLYDTRSSKKQKTPSPKSYRVIRIFTLGLIFAAIIALLAVSVYLCLTCDCISRNFKDLCEEGFCYDITVSTFQDSDNDGSGDFIGIKNSLKFLSQIDVQTIILPLSSFSKTVPHCDVSSFNEMTKQGRKFGISTIIRLDETPKDDHFKLVNEIASSVSGFIVAKDSPYFKKNDTLTKNKCYTLVSSIGDVNVPSNGCGGTFFETYETIHVFSSGMVEILNDSKYTNKSVNILSLKTNDKSATKHTQFLASLMLMGLTNGSMAIKAGDEFGIPINANYSGVFNKSDPFQKESILLMNNVKIHRQYSPKIGGLCDLSVINMDDHPHVKIVSKTCTERDPLETIAMLWNQGNSNVTISMDRVFVVADQTIKSSTILFNANSVKSHFEQNTNNLVLEPLAIVLIDIKFKSTKIV